MERAAQPPQEIQMNQFNASRQRIAQAAQYLPGGVNSNYRMGISPTPLVFTRAEGPFLYDLDGNRLIDYYLGMGPLILGHSPAPVLEAVQRELDRGILYAGQCEAEFEAAQLLCETVPCAERVRFSCAGSEVVQAALRLARAATGRAVIVKFEGHYHGWMDNILWAVAPTPEQLDGAAPSVSENPVSAGQDPRAGAHTEALPWNDVEVLRARLERRDVAAVIMEPIMCNTSAVLPEPGYLEQVREICTRTGTVLVFDEIITGFRVAPGGAQERLGVTPDLATFGKAIASGFPVSAVAGRADIMDLMATGEVMHGGTFNAHPAAMAAAVATLKELRKPETFQNLEVQGNRLMRGMAEVLAAAGLKARVQGLPTVFHVALGTREPIRNYRGSLAADRDAYVKFTTALLARGVRALERGAWFLSTTHTQDEIDQTLEAAAQAARTLDL